MHACGCVSDQIAAALSDFPFYAAYRAGRISSEQYVAEIHAHADEIEDQAGQIHHLHALASRYPRDFDGHVDAVLQDLVSASVIMECPTRTPFAAFEEDVRAGFDHGEHRTYIHPDEAQLVYFLSIAKRPSLLVVMGSFYGYWAIWAMPGVAAVGGEAVLIDPDPEVCALARRNFEALGFGAQTTVYEEEAEQVFPRLPDTVDLALLDAWTSRREPDPSHYGKGIYAPLTEGIFPKLTDNALLIAHNDYYPDIGSNPIAQPFLDSASSELIQFHAFCQRHFRKQRVFATPDGLGVYMK